MAMQEARTPVDQPNTVEPNLGSGRRITLSDITAHSGPTLRLLIDGPSATVDSVRQSLMDNIVKAAYQGPLEEVDPDELGLSANRISVYRMSSPLIHPLSVSLLGSDQPRVIQKTPYIVVEQRENFLGDERLFLKLAV